MNPEHSQLYAYGGGALLFGLILWRRISRMSKLTPLRLERLWIVPAIYIALMIAGMFAPGMMPTGFDWLWLAVATTIGGIVGWYRGKMMQILVDPSTHALNQKGSPLAIILVLAILGVRFGLRAEAATWGLDLRLVTDALGGFAVGMFSLLRVEMFIRARKMLAEARKLSPPLDIQR